MRPHDSRRRRALWLLVGLSLGSWLVTPGLAQFVVAEGADFHNGSTLPRDASATVLSLLARLEKGLALSDAEDVAYVVRALRRERGPDLVSLGDRTDVPALEKALRLVAMRGDERVVARIDADARQATREATRFRDLDALLDLACRGAALPSSSVAALAAARLLFEEGRWWECASLADRVPDVPEAKQLSLAARGRLLRDSSAVHGGPWSLRFSFTRDLDPMGAMPFVADGPMGEVLFHDSVGLIGFDLENSVQTVERVVPVFLWGPRILGAMSEVRALPAPRAHAHARAGRRFVLPFNLPEEPDYPKWRSPKAVRRARLVAGDLGQAPGESPSLAWSVGPAAGGESSAFGTPTIFGDRVFVLLYRIGLDTEVSLVCYRLSSGALLFDTPLVRGSVVPRFASRQAKLDVDELDKRARTGRVAERHGIIYVCTGFGVVAAVDGLDGSIRSTFRYDRLFSLDRGAYDPAHLFDTGGWNDEPVRITQDRIVVAPSDSRFLYMLATEPGPHGQLILEDPIERLDRIDVVDVVPDPAGVTGPEVIATRVRDNRLGLVRLGPNGHVAAASPLLPEGERPTGRPVVVGGLGLVPTNLGIRVFLLRDPARPPGLLSQPPNLPPVAAVFALETGLVGLCPVEDPRSNDEARLYVVYWEALP